MIKLGKEIENKESFSEDLIKLIEKYNILLPSKLLFRVNGERAGFEINNSPQGYSLTILEDPAPAPVLKILIKQKTESK